MHARLKTLATIGSFIALALLASVLATRGSALTAAERNTPVAPQITGIDTWINGSPLTLSQLRGKVVLVDFWTYSCINCIHTIPYVNDWYRKYRDQGLVVVGVHTPEYLFERDPKNVADALKRFDIQYPVAQDNRYDTWRAYGNQYWPALYLIDANGKIVYTRYGEGGYDKTEAAIREALVQAQAQAGEGTKGAMRTQ